MDSGIWRMEMKEEERERKVGQTYEELGRTEHVEIERLHTTDVHAEIAMHSAAIKNSPAILQKSDTTHFLYSSNWKQVFSIISI
jgi:hypothetical protein